MSDTEKVTLLEFPCQFPIKMMGRKSDDFQLTAIELVKKHAGTIADDAISTVSSGNGNFLSVTITISAQSQEQLDNIYRDLTANEAILVAL